MSRFGLLQASSLLPFAARQNPTQQVINEIEQFPTSLVIAGTSPAMTGKIFLSHWAARIEKHWMYFPVGLLGRRSLRHHSRLPPRMGIGLRR